MANFLLELRCEEIPARMQAKAAEYLQQLLGEELGRRGLDIALRMTTFVTPRRLAIIVYGLPDTTPHSSDEIKGPRTSAPPQALEGFLRKTGLTQDQLEDRDGIWFAVVEKPGRATAEVLAEAIPAIVRAFPWPKSMRWGDASLSSGSLRWVRPLQGIVALLGHDVVPFAIEGVAAGDATVGHRFHSRGPVTITSPEAYATALEQAHVIVDQEQRKAIIRGEANRLAREAGLELIPDEGLVAENAGLTEWPVPLLGRFDPAFLEVPPEVIQLTLRINQKYFVLCDGTGKLANAFICTANIVANDGGAAIVAGNGKVLAARLSDARFFWEQDRKTPLAVQAQKLGRITFHEKLGTVADKVERVAKLAEWLANAGIVPDCDPALARRAAELCKADLVTEMVGEFPELQGLMGGYYARAEGLPDAVADAIRDHYKPVGQGDDVPTAPVTVAVSLADKLDTLVGFFLIDERPTGSKDPFALRRAILGVIRLVLDNGMRVGLSMPFQTAMAIQINNLASREAIELDQHFSSIAPEDLRWAVRPAFVSSALDQMDALRKEYINRAYNTATLLSQFLADRLKVQQREAGVRHDLIDAVFALGGEDDLVRLLARVKALQAFVVTPDGANLLAGYKRAANILKKERPDGIKPESEAGEEDPGVALTDPDVAEAIRVHDENVGPGYEPEPAEAALMAALDAAEPHADAAIEAEDFEGAMAALATLRAPIDAFFDAVTVNDPDERKRNSRLNLLTRIRAAVHKVADFSRIES